MQPDTSFDGFNVLKEDTAKLYIAGKRKTNGIRNTLVVKVKNGCVYQLFEVKGQATVSFKCWRRLIK